MQSNPSAQSRPDPGAAPTYPPSFLDRFMRWIQRLPLPYWLTYFLLFLLESLINHALAWLTGWLPLFRANPLLLLFPLWQWFTLAIITYLNSVSQAALDRFRPLLECDDEAFSRLKMEFNSMPTRGMLLSTGIWVMVYFLLTYLAYDVFYVQYGLGTFLTVFTILEGFISFFTGSAIYYHSLRQLWLVNRTVRRVRQFNLFHLSPVYAFSHLTARTGIAWMFLLGFTLLLFPLTLAGGLVWAIIAFQVILALAAFFLPLRSVNQQLVLDKRRLLAEHYLRVEGMLVKLHQRLDQNEMGDMIQFNHALMGLNTERDVLAKIPTWPWSLTTLAGFLSALVSPILLLLIQIAIRKWLGG